jgi:MSHA biogenesis protein MshP
MHPERLAHADTGTLRHCRGFSMIAAVAILVILALLASFIVSISIVQSQSSALDFLGSRAYQAAKAGIEWGAYRVLNPENTAAPRFTGCDSSTTSTFSGLAADLSDFTVAVTCERTTETTEFGNTVRVFQLTSTACNSATCPDNATTSPSYVERQISTVIATCRVGPGNNDAVCG